MQGSITIAAEFIEKTIIRSGRFLNDLDLKERRKVTVIGVRVAEFLFPDTDPAGDRCRELLEQFGLQHKSNELARTCSGGERRRLEIARAMVTRPRLLLLDEPFAAVDPHTVEELQAEVRTLAKQGIAVLVTDHNVQQTLRICDRAYIIHTGRNLRDGAPRDIINDPAVKEAYLASTFRGDEFD